MKETKKSTPIVYIVDDDEGLRRALTTLLATIDYQAASFARPTEFLRQHAPTQPGCVVLDIRMPEMSGLEVQQQLNKMGSMIPVIFITGHGDVPMAVQAMKEGAFDFIQKPFRDQNLLDCINKALQQDAENRKNILRRAELQRKFESLTPRERQVMKLLADGHANKAIAIDLGLSERTVEIHRANVMEKMSAHSVAHLVKMHLTLTGSAA